LLVRIRDRPGSFRGAINSLVSIQDIENAASPLPRNERTSSLVISGLVSLVLGSVLGSATRYFISGFVARRVGETFPWGTLFINVSGSFLIGVFGALAENDASFFASPDPWLFAVTGFLGCYTTVSSFSLQTLALSRDGERGRAVAYIVASVGLCLGAVALGFASVGTLK
jgi:CrcB protein